MRIFPLAEHPSFLAPTLVNFSEHSAFSGKVSNLELPAHRCNFGLIYPLEGSFMFTLNGITQMLDETTFLIVNKNSRFSMRVRNKPAYPFLLYFQSPFPNDMDWAPAERIYTVTESFKNRILGLAALPGSCSSFITMKSNAIVRSIFADIINHNRRSLTEAMELAVKKPSTRVENYRKLAASRDWIEENLSHSLTLEELADVAAMNHQHFLRLFTQVFHKTPRQYIIDRRITEAKKLLTHEDITVSQVCIAVGWDSPGTFNQLFKRKTGKTPIEFRNQSSGNHVL